MENFTPLLSTLGGLMIGCASLLMLAALGRIAGVSGIAAGLLTPVRGDVAWRAAFVGGLVVGGVVMAMVSPPLFAIRLDRSLAVVALAGVVVGLGTRIGGGCTSGHGVCGIGRLSVRSMLATLVFTVTGGVTVYIVQHVIGGAS